MHSRPIVLCNPVLDTASDGAGTTIIKYSLPGPVVPGQYELGPPVYNYVPSLLHLAIKSLVQFPDQIETGRVRIPYRPPSSPSSYDILRSLIPDFVPYHSFPFNRVDPRLWAIIIQVFSNLPEQFQTYPIPLSDKHLPLLQHIAPTPQFCIVTVVELPRCPHLTDDTVFEFKVLHSLSALDVSETQLSGYGVKRLSNTLTWSEATPSEKRGPWPLRILRLRNCKSVDNVVYDALAKFPLLSVVDLRGTRCTPVHSPRSAFVAYNDTRLHYPTPINTSLAHLTAYSKLFSSSRVFTLHVTSLHHTPSRPTTTPDVAMQDAYVVLPPTNTNSRRSRPTKVKVGNSDVLARRIEKREEQDRHERNSMAFRERMERLGAGYDDWGGRDEYEGKWGDWLCQCELDCGGRICMADDEDEEDESDEDDEDSDDNEDSEDDDDDSEENDEFESWTGSTAAMTDTASEDDQQSNAGTTPRDNRSEITNNPVREARRSNIEPLLRSKNDTTSIRTPVVRTPAISVHRDAKKRRIEKISDTIQDHPDAEDEKHSRANMHALPPLPAIPTLKSRSSTPSLDLLNSIAEAEAREHTAKQSASSFYRAPPRNSRTQARMTAREPVRMGDERLMLYRDPPPWDTLGTSTQKKTHTQLKAVRGTTDLGVVNLNKESMLGKQGMSALAEAINKKKAMSLAPPSRTVQTPVPTPAPRNPFRRKSVPDTPTPSQTQKISTGSYDWKKWGKK